MYQLNCTAVYLWAILPLLRSSKLPLTHPTYSPRQPLAK